MASSLLHNLKVLSFWGLFSFSNVFQLEEALLCGLSLIYQVLLVVTGHFKLKKATKISEKRNCQRVCYITYYQGFMTAIHEEQITK